MCHPHCTVYIRRGEKQPVNGSWPVRVWLPSQDILICISLVIDTFLLLTPLGQSEAVLRRVDQSEASMLSAGARPAVCVGIQTKVLCCDQRRIPGWDDEIKHSQMGLHFSQFLIAPCISYSLTFVRMIGFVAWTIPTNYSWILQLSNVWYIHCLRRGKCLMHICRQMSGISCIFLFNQTF